MDKSQLSETSKVALCAHFAKHGYVDLDRGVEEVIHPEEVIINNRKFYNLSRAYCSLARELPEDFWDRCPNPRNCPYADGRAREVKVRNS